MKRVLVTGSEGKIGKRICLELSRDYQVVHVDITLGYDLTNPEVVQKIFANSDPIYAVINCHAHNPIPTKQEAKKEPVDFSLDELRSYVEVNLISLFDVCRQYIKTNESGRIVNLSSLYGLRSPKHYIYDNYVKPLGYVLTKTAVLSLTKYLASYYAPQFLVNSVVFGGLFDSRQEETFRKNYAQHTPVGRMMMEDEIYSVFRFLLDDSNTYTTGTEIVVDGGWSSW